MHYRNATTLVMRDDHGFFIREGSKLFRPGPVKDSIFTETDDGGVRPGIVVAAVPVQQTHFMRVRTPQGFRYWSSLEPTHEDRL